MTAAGGGFDIDQDGWSNRIDDCPLVSNVTGGQDVPPGTAVSDGGPPSDGIGAACDLSPTTSDGHFHEAGSEILDFACNSGTDGDGDGWCFDKENSVGTGDNKDCANDDTDDNEADDGVPVDFNDDGAVNVQDRSRIVSQILSGVFSTRFDLNNDGFITNLDRFAVVISQGFTCL